MTTKKACTNCVYKWSIKDKDEPCCRCENASEWIQEYTQGYLK